MDETGCRTDVTVTEVIETTKPLGNVPISTTDDDLLSC